MSINTEISVRAGTILNLDSMNLYSTNLPTE